MNQKLLAQAKDIVSARNGYYVWSDVDTQTQSGLVDEVAVEYEKLLRIGKTTKQRRDYFAGMALQAIIGKMPFFDEKGEFGKKITKEELTDLKHHSSEAAWNYADWMLFTETSTTE